MSSWAKRLEGATNVAILCAFLLVGALAAKRLFWEGQPHANSPVVGAKVSVQGVDWSRSKQNLVLALSTGCHFCTDSADFYQRLIPSASKGGVRVLAVLPQPVSDSRSYLARLGVSISEIVQSPLSTIEVSGTPTLLIVDNHGKIQKAWVGKLAPEQERKVLAGLD